jgi:hypothetical protein
MLNPRQSLYQASLLTRLQSAIAINPVDGVTKWRPRQEEATSATTLPGFNSVIANFILDYSFSAVACAFLRLVGCDSSHLFYWRVGVVWTYRRR